MKDRTVTADMLDTMIREMGGEPTVQRVAEYLGVTSGYVEDMARDNPSRFCIRTEQGVRDGCRPCPYVSRIQRTENLVAAKADFPALQAQELAKARAKHPGPIHGPHEAYGVIREELDEFWDDVKSDRTKRAPSHVLQELLQVAAMCQRAAEDLSLLPPAGGV